MVPATLLSTKTGLIKQTRLSTQFAIVMEMEIPIIGQVFSSRNDDQ